MALEPETTMNLPDVARTAILTLICRVIESEKKEPILNDPMAVLCLERLTARASAEEKIWIVKRKKMYEGRGSAEVIANARRQKTFDSAANQFVATHPGCTVVNLGGGFDTRFWRIENVKCSYVEIDLPEVIDLKKELLKDQLTYELIGCSVLDTAWIDQVTAQGNSQMLLMAEGLFMYLPAREAADLLRAIAQRFVQSQLVLDMLPEKYTRGFLKWIVGLRIRAAWGLDVSFLSGIKQPHDLDAYGFRVIDQAEGSLGPIITAAINAG